MEKPKSRLALGSWTMDAANFISPAVCFLKHYFCNLWILPPTAYLHTPEIMFGSFLMTSCPADNCIPCVPQSNCTLHEKLFPFRNWNLSSFWISLLPEHSVWVQTGLYKHSSPFLSVSSCKQPQSPSLSPRRLPLYMVTAVSFLWRQPGFPLYLLDIGKHSYALWVSPFRYTCSLQIPTSGSSSLLYPQLYSYLPIGIFPKFVLSSWGSWLPVLFPWSFGRTW